MKISWEKRPLRHRGKEEELYPIKRAESISSTYRGVRGTRQQDGSILWRPYVKRPGGVRPSGFITYTSERQAAIAYDEHMIKECGHDTALNFDAETHKARKRAERRARQEVKAELSHLRHLREQGHITEEEMWSRIRGPSTHDLDKLSISNPPAKAEGGSAEDTEVEASDGEVDFFKKLLRSYIYSS